MIILVLPVPTLLYVSTQILAQATEMPVHLLFSPHFALLNATTLSPAADKKNDGNIYTCKIENLSGLATYQAHSKSQPKQKRYLHAHNSQGNHMYSGASHASPRSSPPATEKGCYKTSTSLGDGNGKW